MSASTPIAEQPTEAVLDSLHVLRRKRRLGRLVDVFIEAGISEATGYRRIKEPEAITLRELSQISGRFGPPVVVLAQGDFATMQWLRDNEAGPDDGPGLDLYPPWDSNPEPADIRGTPGQRHLTPVGATRAA